MIYLYTEDSKSGFEFWNFICSSLFNDKIEVRNLGSKSNASRLAKFVNSITDRDNTYLIAYDYSFDNPSVMEDYRSMKKYINENNYNNIVLLNFISFEYILLSFTNLIDWCFSKDDEFKKKRENLIKCRELLVSLGIESINKYNTVPELLDIIKEYKSSNIEQLCSKLLFYIVRNTGFEVNKNIFGECWYVNCCEYSNLQDDDECGLDGKFYTDKYKALSIFNSSCIKKRFLELDIIINEPFKYSILFNSLLSQKGIDNK